jgi:putative addiction module CopG family antidote
MQLAKCVNIAQYCSVGYNSIMSETARLNISLPGKMLSGINHLVEGGEYSTPSEFVRDAVRREMERRNDKNQKEQALKHFRDLADEALNSGDAVEVSDIQAWKQSHMAGLEARLSAKKHRS